MQKKSLDSADETRTFEKGKIELANLGDTTIDRVTLEPGWSWENCGKPIIKTDSCQAPHTQLYTLWLLLRERKAGRLLWGQPDNSKS
jgi:hypothetical protein